MKKLIAVLPLVIPVKMMTRIYLAIMYSAFLFIAASFVGCGKDETPQEVRPVISGIFITDTTPSSDGYSVIDGFVKTQNSIGIISTGYVGGYIATHGDSASFSIEVENGVRTPVILTAIDYWPNPVLVDIDTVWVFIPRSIGTPQDTIEDPDPTPKNLREILTSRVGKWEGNMMYDDYNLGVSYQVEPTFSSASFFTNGVCQLQTFSGYIWDEFSVSSDQDTLFCAGKYKVLYYSIDSIKLKFIDNFPDGDYLLTLK